MTSTHTAHTSTGDHDHTVCVDQAMRQAEELCQQKQLRLTELRKQVLSLVWQTHKPIGAYAIMELLQAASSRQRVAPPTVYRTLDFLVEHGFVHKVRTLNAFIGCSNPQHKQCDALLICTVCGYTEELPNNTIQQTIRLSASKQGFSVEEQILEIAGCCAYCKPNKNTDKVTL